MYWYVFKCFQKLEDFELCRIRGTAGRGVKLVKQIKIPQGSRHAAC